MVTVTSPGVVTISVTLECTEKLIVDTAKQMVNKAVAAGIGMGHITPYDTLLYMIMKQSGALEYATKVMENAIPPTS